MDSYAESDVRALLESFGHGWGEISEVDAGGAMAASLLAIHMNASSPDHNVHIKVYLVAENDGTDLYRKMGSPERLRRLHERFVKIRSATEVASVTIRALQFDEARGLVLIMDRVRTVADMLATEDLAVLRAGAPRMLRDLDPTDSWYHMDICPQNVGRTDDGSFCFLDLESLYPMGSSVVVVSLLMTKYRAPHEVCLRVYAACRDKECLEPALASLFHAHQVSWLAAEMFLGCHLSQEDLLAIERLDPVNAAMWRSQFVEPMAKGAAPVPNELAVALEECLA
ncbi:MAG: hypothetical protein ABL963_06880 [Longimicrobiales bacterium]